MKFNIEVDMQARWIPHFLSMLKYMQYLGGIGSSRRVGLLSDGDGDFQPKFKWSNELPAANKEPVWEKNGDRLYDAG